MIKSPPELQETSVRFLCWEDPLEEGKATTPVFLPGESRIPMGRGAWQIIVHEVAKSLTLLSD